MPQFEATAEVDVSVGIGQERREFRYGEVNLHDAAANLPPSDVRDEVLRQFGGVEMQQANGANTRLITSAELKEMEPDWNVEDFDTADLPPVVVPPLMLVPEPLSLGPAAG